MNRTLNVSDQAKQQYKQTSPASWKKCKGSESILEQKIRDKVSRGKTVSSDRGCMVVRYFFLNFLIDLHSNEVIQVSEIKDQPPVYLRKNKLSRYELLKRRVIQKSLNIYRYLKYSVSSKKYAASFDGSHRNGQIGIGFRITSSDGQVTIYEHSEAVECKKSMDSSDAELIALIRLLEKVKELNIRSIKITGDCRGFIDVINFNYKVRPRLQKYIQTIRSLMACDGVKISYAKRRYNQAHSLSRLSTINQEG